MRSLPAAGLLAVWERVRDETRARRGALLLELLGAEGAAVWPIGRRDAALLALREEHFGRKLECLTSCPECDEAIELEFETRDIRAAAANDAAVMIPWDGRELRARLPNSEDLEAIATLEEPVESRRQLLARCLNGSADGVAITDDLLALAGQRMSEADPQAEVELALRCPHCTRAWTAPFDIAEFLWTEWSAHAERLLAEVHDLARAYGWREDDILSLSPARRAAYLKMIAA